MVIKKIPDQEKIWDEIAEQWNKFRKKPILEVVEFLKDKKGNILDLGCASGRHLCKLNGTFYGIDFSQKMLDLAKKKAEKNKINCKLIKSDLKKLPFKNNFFDSAIFINSLHCIIKKSDREKALRELNRVLKKGAEALIIVWSKEQPRFKKEKKEIILSWTAGKKRRLRYYYLYKQKELLNLLINLNFKILNTINLKTPKSFCQKRIIVRVKK